MNSTPMRLADRQITRQFRFINSGLISSVNSSGMPTGLSMSRAAPAFDKFLIVQSMATAVPNMMEPPLKVRCRDMRRFSIAVDSLATPNCMSVKVIESKK